MPQTARNAWKGIRDWKWVIDYTKEEKKLEGKQHGAFIQSKERLNSYRCTKQKEDKLENKSDRIEERVKDE